MAYTDKHLTELVSLRAVVPEPLCQLRNGERGVPLFGEMRSSGDDDRHLDLARTYHSVRCPLLSSTFLPRGSPVSHETGDEEFYVSK